MRSLRENHFLQPFDWPQWQATALRIPKEPSRLPKADLKTRVKSITLHVRKDRFVGGHFGEMVRCVTSWRSCTGQPSYVNRLQFARRAKAHGNILMEFLAR
jgi:hypothetical protein